MWVYSTGEFILTEFGITINFRTEFIGKEHFKHIFFP
jgi:hypothetical protein